ncbi:MAG: peptidoglycan-binding domain-containing protein [Ilumatobacteraceae bacterium]
MRRTRILLLLSAVGGLSLAACSSDSPSATTGSSADSTAASVTTAAAVTTTSAPAATAESTSTTSAATSTTVAGSRSVTDPADNVKLGDTGEGVKIIQYTLVANGSKIGVDGNFGPVTDAAVRDFQKSKGLTVDGVVGPKTWAAMQQGAGVTTTTVAGGTATTAAATTTT